MDCRDIRFSGHAIRRMFDRQVSPADVRTIIDDGEIVRDYPDDQPLPSRLLLGQAGGRVLHVVVAFEVQTGMCKVVTVYRPDPPLWQTDFKTRRTP